MGHAEVWRLGLQHAPSLPLALTQTTPSCRHGLPLPQYHELDCRHSPSQIRHPHSSSPLHTLPPPQYHELDTVEVDIPALNELLKSPDFWGSLSADGVQTVLFFQTDSLLLHGNIQPFMQVRRRPAVAHAVL